MPLSYTRLTLPLSCRYIAAMPDALDPPARVYPFSNVERARLAGLRSVESKRAKAQLAAQHQDEQTALVQTVLATVGTDDFANQRLSRVRAQLVLLDAMITKETDPKRLKCLCDASARLSTQEFALCGRPLPGSRRPKDHEPHGQQPGAWIEVRPVPQVQDVQPANPVQPPAVPTVPVPPANPVSPPASDTPTGSVQPPS